MNETSRFCIKMQLTSNIFKPQKQQLNVSTTLNFVETKKELLMGKSKMQVVTNAVFDRLTGR
jgi:hypothetical protein